MEGPIGRVHRRLTPPLGGWHRNVPTPFMTTIKMIRQWNGYNPKAVATVRDQTAVALIKSGYAELVQAPKPIKATKKGAE